MVINKIKKQNKNFMHAHLHHFEALQNVSALAASHAFNHEIIARCRHLNYCPTLFRPVAAETYDIGRHVFEGGPIFQTRITGAIKPVQLFKLCLTLFAPLLRINGTIIFSDLQTRLDGPYGVHMYGSAAMVSTIQQKNKILCFFNMICIISTSQHQGHKSD